jgi:GNAT superfamily N-acetyltransferase
MNILPISNTNFGAKFIKKAEISKFNDAKQQGYIPVDASLVELNPYNKNDIEAVAKIVKKWGYDDEFGYCILDDLQAIKSGTSDSKTDKIYAVTVQNNNFRKLDSNKIIGLGEITKRNLRQTEINFLQVEPESTYLKASKKYINVGRTLVEYFMSKNGFKELIVKATYKAANFYEKMGFEIIDTKELIYAWQKLIKK